MRPSVDELRARFADGFPAATIEVIDDSRLHAGHAGAAGGAGHFRVRLVSERFAGLGTVARHRLVYDAVRDWMPQRIHALVIDARTPAEAS
ncbi:MAG: DNA-binding transcriptional regulator BolA [Pseudorhodoplanes sp.]|nr:DNA-binding transcriptional regulator BolA [Pseudorhodoplanes sp.]